MINASVRRRLRIYALEARYECVKQYRLPAQIVFGLAFPLIFYTVFGLIFGRGGDAGSGSFPLFYIATYGAFGIISTALFGFGVGVATERGQGWMVLKRASPMPHEAYFLGKLALSVVSATAVVLLLSASGVLLLGVRVSPIAWLEMAVLLILGVMPFCALGLAIGYWVGPNAAVAVVNLLNMPMAILSGLWIPFSVLPTFVHDLARYLPSYHYSQLALETIGLNQPGSTLGHVLALIGFTMLCTAIAYAGYRRDEDKTYG